MYIVDITFAYPTSVKARKARVSCSSSVALMVRSDVYFLHQETQRRSSRAAIYCEACELVVGAKYTMIPSPPVFLSVQPHQFGHALPIYRFHEINQHLTK